jgi:hypothetical protein
VHADKAMLTLLRVARAALPFLPAVQVQMPENLPPIGSTLASEDGALAIEVFVPSSTTNGLISAGLQLQQQFQNNNDGGL